MYCTHCGSEIASGAVLCLTCGVGTAKPGVTSAGKSRVAYILLGVLLGMFGFPGIHNLYAGYYGRGMIQLLATVLSCWLLWPPIWIWAIVEACVVTRDARGEALV